MGFLYNKKGSAGIDTFDLNLPCSDVKFTVRRSIGSKVTGIAEEIHYDSQFNNSEIYSHNLYP